MSVTHKTHSQIKHLHTNGSPPRCRSATCHMRCHMRCHSKRSRSTSSHLLKSLSSRTCASSSGVKSFTILNLTLDDAGRKRKFARFVTIPFIKRHTSIFYPWILQYYQQQSDIFGLFNGCQMDIRFTSELNTACESLPCSCLWSWRQPERTPLDFDALRFTTCYGFILYWLYIGFITHVHTLCHVTDLRASQVQKALDVKIIGSQNQLEKDLSSIVTRIQNKQSMAQLLALKLYQIYTLTICRGLLFNVDIPGGCEFHTTWDLTSVASNVEVLKRLWGTHCPTQRRHIQPSSYLPALFRCNKALQTCICAGAHSSGASESLQADCPCGTWGKDAKCWNKSTRRTGTLLCYSASGNLSCNSQWPGIASRNAQIQDCS